MNQSIKDDVKSAITTQDYKPDQITDPHKFTKNTQQAFKKIIDKISINPKSKKLPDDYLSIIKLIYRGRIVCRNVDCFQVSVSARLVNRAILLLDALSKELEKRSFKIRYIQDKLGGIVVAIKDGESISFQISEGYKYHSINNDRRSELEKMLFRNQEAVPTGKLSLYILARDTHISQRWSDDKSQIEECLPKIIVAFDRLVLRQKQRKIDNALRDDRRIEESKIFSEIQSKKYGEKAIYDNAMQEAQSFIAHTHLETYLNHLEVSYIKEYGRLDEAALSWILTAKKVSEMHNPANKRLEMLSAL